MTDANSPFLLKYHQTHVPLSSPRCDCSVSRRFAPTNRPLKSVVFLHRHREKRSTNFADHVKITADSFHKVVGSSGTPTLESLHERTCTKSESSTKPCAFFVLRLSILCPARRTIHHHCSDSELQCTTTPCLSAGQVAHHLSGYQLSWIT